MKSIFNDKPVTIEEVTTKGLKEKISQYDSLGIQDYAEALAKFIQECETPMTIGIQGDWGIGKTSLLNMIKAYLEGARGKQFGFIWFDTWHYSQFGQDEFLGIAVIKGLLDLIKRKFNIDEKNNILQETSKKLSNILKNTKFSAFGFSVTPGDAMKGDESIEDKFGYSDISSIMLEFKSDFQKLIKYIVENCKIPDKYGNMNVVNRIVIFIDDLDRVKPIKALELLESVKNFLDVENCVFVLAVDYEVVQIGMAEKLGSDLQKMSGKSFFDKIIQLPFTMPSTSYNLGNYIKELLNKSKFKVSDSEIDFYEEVTSCTVGRNPRSIKRVINYAQLIRIIRKTHATKDTKDTEQQRKILYSLICMQVAWPEIYNHFVKSPTPATIKNIENWEYLDHIPFIHKLYERTVNRDQLKSDISVYFDILFDLLDEDNNGTITKKELKPVWDVLQIARLTSTADFRQSIDIFFEYFDENKKKSSSTKDIFNALKNAFRKSKWNGAKIEYRMSGKRYATLIHNRKQIGSIVTLVTKPFIFRLDINEQDIIRELQEIIGDEIQVNTIIGSVQDASLTGFGDVLIDVEKLVTNTKIDTVKFLNQLHDLVITN